MLKKYIFYFINIFQESADVIQRDVANHVLMEDASLDVYLSLFQIERSRRANSEMKVKVCECFARARAHKC